MMSDIQKAYERFKAVSDIYTAYFNYYDGDQPLRYSVKRLEDAFDQKMVKFRENWCTVVIDAVMDRMELYGWNTADESVNDLLSKIWASSGLALESNEVHESAMICGESFLIGWQDEGRDLEFYYNDPRKAAVFYDPDHPKVKKFAAKWWDDDDGCHMVLYYPDRLEKYFARGRQMVEIDANAGGFRVFQLEVSERNPYGVIPVFHFRNALRIVKSDLKNVVELQDAVNKLLCDMMVTAEFDAFPARYVISNADIETLKNSPGQIWDLPAGFGEGQGTSVGTLEAANLANYSDQINDIASAIAVITATPKHYFERTSAQVSGEALITMEAPLVKKVEKKRELFGDVWQEVAVFALLVSGITAQKSDIQPQWGPAEADQPLTETQVIKTYRDAGLPIRSAMRLAGYTEAEITVIEEEIAEERQNSEDLAAIYLNQARDREVE
jgi:hypothetical protein